MKIEKNKTFFKNHEKMSQSALFSPPGRWTGNYFLFKGGLRYAGNDYAHSLAQFYLTLNYHLLLTELEK